MDHAKHGGTGLGRDDLVLMDCTMPGLDGYETTGRDSTEILSWWRPSAVA